MIEEVVCAGVDVAKNTLDVTVSSSEGIRQFANDHEDITNAVRYIAGLKPARIIIRGGTYANRGTPKPEVIGSIPINATFPKNRT